MHTLYEEKDANNVLVPPPSRPSTISDYMSGSSGGSEVTMLSNSSRTTYDDIQGTDLMKNEKKTKQKGINSQTEEALGPEQFGDALGYNRSKAYQGLSRKSPQYPYWKNGDNESRNIGRSTEGGRAEMFSNPSDFQMFENGDHPVSAALSRGRLSASSSRPPFRKQPSSDLSEIPSSGVYSPPRMYSHPEAVCMNNIPRERERQNMYMRSRTPLRSSLIYQQRNSSGDVGIASKNSSRVPSDNVPNNSLLYGVDPDWKRGTNHHRRSVSTDSQFDTRPYSKVRGSRRPISEDLSRDLSKVNLNGEYNPDRRVISDYYKYLFDESHESSYSEASEHLPSADEQGMPSRGAFKSFESISSANSEGGSDFTKPWLRDGPIRERRQRKNAESLHRHLGSNEERKNRDRASKSLELKPPNLARQSKVMEDKDYKIPHAARMSFFNLNNDFGSLSPQFSPKDYGPPSRADYRLSMPPMYPYPNMYSYPTMSDYRGLSPMGPTNDSKRMSMPILSPSSPPENNVSEKSMIKKIEVFRELRKEIASGKKSIDYKLKWIKMLLNAVNYKLYQYINIKGDNILQDQVSYNKSIYVSSTLKYLEKLINEEKEMDEYPRVYSEAYYLYGCMVKGDYEDTFGLHFGLERDIDTCVSFFEKSLEIDPDNFKSLFKVGEVYEDYFTEEFDTAVEFYRKSAKMGYSVAILKMAQLYFNEPSIRSTRFIKYLVSLSNIDLESKDIKLEFDDFDDLENSVALANFELGKLYEGLFPGDLSADDAFVQRTLEYAPVNYSKSLTYYNTSAKLGCSLAWVKLAKVYEEGELNRAYNPNKSIYWYTKTATCPLKFKRSAEAFLGLSRWNLKGTEGQSKLIPFPDPLKALQWCQDAIDEFGTSECYYYMGELAEAGLGDCNPQKWFDLAHNSGNDAASNLEKCIF